MIRPITRGVTRLTELRGLFVNESMINDEGLAKVVRLQFLEALGLSRAKYYGQRLNSFRKVWKPPLAVAE